MDVANQVNEIANISVARREIEMATTVESLLEGYTKLSAIENYMRDSKLYPLEKIQENVTLLPTPGNLRNTTRTLVGRSPDMKHMFDGDIQELA